MGGTRRKWRSIIEHPRLVPFGEVQLLVERINVFPVAQYFLHKDMSGSSIATMEKLATNLLLFREADARHIVSTSSDYKLFENIISSTCSSSNP